MTAQIASSISSHSHPDTGAHIVSFALNCAGESEYDSPKLLDPSVGGTRGHLPREGQHQGRHLVLWHHRVGADLAAEHR